MVMEIAVLKNGNTTHGIIIIMRVAEILQPTEEDVILLLLFIYFLLTSNEDRTNYFKCILCSTKMFG